MSALLIVLRGFPERVQQIADVIDLAFPGIVSWVQAEDIPDGMSIQIEGQEAGEVIDVSPLPFGGLTDSIADVGEPA